MLNIQASRKKTFLRRYFTLIIYGVEVILIINCIFNIIRSDSKLKSVNISFGNLQLFNNLVHVKIVKLEYWYSYKYINNGTKIDEKSKAYFPNLNSFPILHTGYFSAQRTFCMESFHYIIMRKYIDLYTFHFMDFEYLRNNWHIKYLENKEITLL